MESTSSTSFLPPSTPPATASAGSQTKPKGDGSSVKAVSSSQHSVVVNKGGGTPIIVGLLPTGLSAGRTTTATVLSVSRAAPLQLISKSSASQSTTVGKATVSVPTAASPAQVTVAAMPTTHFSNKPIIINRTSSAKEPHLLACLPQPGPQSSMGQGAGKPKSFAALMAAETSSTTPSKKQPTPAKKAQPSKSTSSSKSAHPKTMKTTPSSIESTPQPTRSSQRNVKRPKTYDEELAELELAAKTVKRPKGGGSSRTSHKKGGRARCSGAAKDLGRWKPADDLMLISAIQQTNDISAVHLGVKFSCRFTLKEVQERWYALLYDPQISKIAVEAMRALPPGVVTMALNNALWSVEEEAVLARTPSTDPGHLETFQSLLKAHPSVFHACRTPTSLHHHWVLMGHYKLLNNQKIDLIPPGDTVVNFTDAEDQMNDNELAKPRDVKEEALEQELIASERHVKREIMRLEEELPGWKTIIDTGALPEFSSGVYAILKGKVVEFMMTSHSVTLGRNSAAGQVDFDLSLEAPAFKISRRQASIRLTSDGDFILHNEGRRPVYLGGKAVVSGKSAKLQHQQVLEVATMSFLVLLNFALVHSMAT